MKKKKLKAKLLQLEEERLKAVQAKRGLLKDLRAAYETIKQFEHIDICKPGSEIYCSGCRGVVNTLRNMLAPYQMDFMIEDVYLPAVKEQIERANKLFFPEHYDWSLGESKDQTHQD